MKTLGFVALWYKWACRSRGGTFFNASSLGQGFVMSLDGVNNNSPFAMNINSTKRLDVSSFRWAKIGFFNNILQPCY